MKVCQIISSNRSGGLGKYVVELSNSLSTQIDISVISPADFIGSLNSDVVHIPFDFKGSNYNPIMLLRLWRQIQKIGPDILHAHGTAATKLVRAIKPFIKAKCIATVHWHLKRRRNRTSYERMDWVIGVSNTVIATIETKNKSAIYNGVPPQENRYCKAQVCREMKIDQNRPLLIAIGRLVNGKGFDILLEAMHGVNANLLLIGSGKEEGNLKALTNKLGISDKIVFAGHIENAALLISAADLVVISSRQEGFSYVLAEALMYKKPLISTKTSGPSEILPCECLVDINNADALRVKIIECLFDLNAFSLLLADTFTWAENSLSLNEMTKRNITVYQDLLTP